MIVALIVMSPGRINPLKNENGEVIPNSISEIKQIRIGGIEQGLIVRGVNEKNPVLLFLHGGPGTTEYIPTKYSELNMEEDFTVCYWEQRGAGKSYEAADSDDITVDQMISDTVEVTNYLRQRFKKNKIFVMGHSWGSFLGIQVIAQYPELFQAYIGTGQIKCAIEGEKKVLGSMIEKAKKQNSTALVKKLTNSSVKKNNEVSDSYFVTKEKARAELNMIPEEVDGTTLKEDLSQLICSEEYTILEKFYYIRGSMISGKSKRLFKEFIKCDLAEEIPKVEIPVYFLQGVYDDQTPYSLAKKYYNLLQAPKKGFYRFGKSAHNPMYEESKKFMTIMKKIKSISNVQD